MPLPRFRLRTLMIAVAVVAISMWFTQLGRHQEAMVVLGLLIFALPLVPLLVMIDDMLPPDPPPPK